MKKRMFLFLLFVCSIIFSCTSKSKEISSIKKSENDTEIISKKIKSYMNANANDPKSYEPINTVLYDSLTYLKDITSQIKDAFHTLEFDKKERRMFGPSMSAYYKSEAKSDQKKVDSLTNLKDSILKTNNPYRLEFYYFLHNCRLKNGYGGLVKNTYRIITDPSLNIIRVIQIKE